MSRGRGHRDNLEESGRELNIIPYLDIMVNLVMFLLISITSFVSFTILNASIPLIAPDSAKASETMKRSQLLLMVRVKREGFDIDPSVQGGPPAKRTMVPKKENALDYEGLRAVVAQLKKQFESESRVLIMADPMTVYDDIIKTMDTLRESAPGKEDLFPDVTLSIL